jgi:hypothetical protein
MSNRNGVVGVIDSGDGITGLRILHARTKNKAAQPLTLLREGKVGPPKFRNRAELL